MSKLVPTLRFKEFSGDWEEIELGELLEFKNGINANKEQYGSGYKFINVLDVLNNEFILHDKIIGSVNIDESVRKKNLVEYGDILFQRSSETQDEVGTASVYLDKHHTATFGGFVIRGKKIKNYEPIFLNKLLKTKLSRNQITLKSAGSTRYNVGQGILSSVVLPFPSSSEQQKIAKTLTSLDNLIEAQTKKIETLKKHKKGLMQKLFPLDGEKKPKVRFDEFSGDWEDKSLDNVGNIVTGTTPSTKKDEYYRNGIYPWVTPTDITEKKDISNSKKLLSQDGLNHSRFIPKNSLLVTCIASIGKNTILRQDGSCNQQINAISVYKDYCVDFLYYLIEEKNYILLANAGQGGMAMLNKSDFSKLKFYFPKLKEQQKIANTLSSLDNLIEAQTKKVETLKQHKKGLMQKLFVNKEEN